MRRLAFRAALLVVFLPSAGWAQRGGMRGGGGFSSHGGFASRGSGRTSGPAMLARSSHSSIHFGNSFHAPNRHPIHTVHTGHAGHAGHIHFHSDPRWWWYSPYGYANYGGYYDPFYWDRYSSSSDSRNDDYVAQRETARQVDELSQEVQNLRADREYSQASAAPAPPVRAETKAAPDMTTVLVFLDKRIQEVKNYAIANEQVVVFDDRRTKKIPLADIDLAATMKLNDERGVDFQVPNPTGTE